MTRSKKIWNSVWVVTGRNFLLVMVLYSLMRVFYYLIHNDWYPEMTSSHLWEIMLGGIRFDLSALLYLNSLYILLMLIPLPLKWRTAPAYQTIAKWCYLIPNGIGIVVNCIDMVYTAFSDRRSTLAVLSEFQNDNNLGEILKDGAVEYWYVTLFGVVMLTALRLLVATCENKGESGWKRHIVEVPAFLATVYLIVMGIRGGFGAWTRPLNMSHANQYADSAAEVMLVLNTPFSLMQGSEGVVFKERHYCEHPEMWVNPQHMGGSASATDSVHATDIPVRKGRNVVIIIAESFGKEYFGYYNHDQEGGKYMGYTPFLDSLCAESVTYKYSYASGRKSIDAMPSILSSIPSLIQPYVLTPYSANRVSSIAHCLRAEGYHTAFFHGAPNGSMGFQAYARSAGFEKYYGMNEYNGPSAFDGTWAIWDEEFLQYYAHVLDTLPEPHMTTVFTASSHHPYKVPERYKDMFDKGTLPIHESIGYSDMAFRKFFDYARKQSWFENTLFVFVADHTNLRDLPEYGTAEGIYRVPILFYARDLEPRLDTTQVVSQTDIMPSVLGYLGYDKDYFAWGEDVLTSTKKNNWAVCYNHPFFQLITKQGILRYDGEMVTEDTTGEPEALAYLQAYIQDYVSRMIHNRLRIE